VGSEASCAGVQRRAFILPELNLWVPLLAYKEVPVVSLRSTHPTNSSNLEELFFRTLKENPKCLSVCLSVLVMCDNLCQRL